MSEYVPNIRNPNYAEIRMEGDSEFKQFGFQMFGLLELQPKRWKYDMATPTIIQHLNYIFFNPSPHPASPFGVMESVVVRT